MLLLYFLKRCFKLSSMISLSLCMIVKNEEKVLPRILKPMKEIVDKILICDTGSTDRTKRNYQRIYSRSL